eukprot:CAMPEP_0185378820 /NCGR_PEP_ID=MMETSP1364-20130426/46197_1 /TAXON_ID=38817 /ORGANISM="Gephyrocapsa oceanica, Strain RCC1303" /LENGTH=63 /DNA_ID=CAMNT_0027980371 /DNA_START=1 /DNA_END=189 /DNA_ORIENTATION=-
MASPTSTTPACGGKPAPRRLRDGADGLERPAQLAPPPGAACARYLGGLSAVSRPSEGGAAGAA